MTTTTAPMAKKLTASPEDLINATQAGELLGISTSAFRYHARDGKIEAVQTITIGGWFMPLYRRSDVLALGEQVRPGGQAGKGRPRKSDRK